MTAEQTQFADKDYGPGYTITELGRTVFGLTTLEIKSVHTWSVSHTQKWDGNS